MTVVNFFACNSESPSLARGLGKKLCCDLLLEEVQQSNSSGLALSALVPTRIMLFHLSSPTKPFSTSIWKPLGLLISPAHLADAWVRELIPGVNPGSEVQAAHCRSRHGAPLQEQARCDHLVFVDYSTVEYSSTPNITRTLSTGMCNPLWRKCYIS